MEIVFNVVLNDVMNVRKKVCDSIIFQIILVAFTSGRSLLSSRYRKE